MATRVLIGNAEPIVRLGIAAVLRERGVDVIGEEGRPRPLVLLAGQLHPDAVVLDLHQRDVAARVREASPDAVVVLWARDEEVMEVLGDEPRRVESPTADDLGQALTRVRSIGSP